MVDRIRWDTVSYLPFYYVFFQFLLLTIFNLQANILTTKDILSNLATNKQTNNKGGRGAVMPHATAEERVTRVVSNQQIVVWDTKNTPNTP